MDFYSQYGEDFLLYNFFDKKSSGVFVDVGAHDGKRFSNTYTLELNGWKGICIEPHKQFYSQLVKNRPNSECYNVAISNVDKNNSIFYANKRGALSSLDETKKSMFLPYGDYFTGFEKQDIDVAKIDTLLEKSNIESIDYVSIDVEGTEIDVVKGFNLDKYKPRVLVIEYNDKELLDDYMLLTRNYIPGIHSGCNRFYFRTMEDHDRMEVINKLSKPKLLTSPVIIDGVVQGE